MQRSYTLDYIRVIAMVGVITDHYMQYTHVDWLVNSGLQIGGGVLLSSCCYLHTYLA